MDKKIISLSIFSAVVILLAGCTPALASSENNMFAVKTERINIEVNHYLGRQTERNQLTVTADEAEQIRFYLTELYNAQQRNDRAAIATYESLLYEKVSLGYIIHGSPWISMDAPYWKRQGSPRRLYPWLMRTSPTACVISTRLVKERCFGGLVWHLYNNLLMQ